MDDDIPIGPKLRNTNRLFQTRREGLCDTPFSCYGM